MRLLHRPFIVTAILVIALAAIGAISATLYLGVFSPHPQIALDTFNDVYGTSGTRLEICSTCHTTGRSDVCANIPLSGNRPDTGGRKRP